MPLFGTFSNEKTKKTELAPGNWEHSTLTRGYVTDVSPNFGTAGGEVRYRWIPIRWKPYVPDPQRLMFTPVKAFPERRVRISSQQFPGKVSQTKPVTFTPPDVASITFHDSSTGMS